MVIRWTYLNFLDKSTNLHCKWTNDWSFQRFKKKKRTLHRPTPWKKYIFKRIIRKKKTLIPAFLSHYPWDCWGSELLGMFHFHPPCNSKENNLVRNSLPHCSSETLDLHMDWSEASPLSLCMPCLRSHLPPFAPTTYSVANASSTEASEEATNSKHCGAEVEFPVETGPCEVQLNHRKVL